MSESKAGAPRPWKCVSIWRRMRGKRLPVFWHGLEQWQHCSKRNTCRLVDLLTVFCGLVFCVVRLFFRIGVQSAMGFLDHKPEFDVLIPSNSSEFFRLVSAGTGAAPPLCTYETPLMTCRLLAGSWCPRPLVRRDLSDSPQTFATASHRAKIGSCEWSDSSSHRLTFKTTCRGCNWELAVRQSGDTRT